MTNNNDYKFLLNERRNFTMKIRRLRTLALEIYKTLSNVTPNSIRDIFDFSLQSTHRKHDIFPNS